MKLTFDRFGGIAPRLADHLLREGAAVVANNCRLMGGELAPWRNPSLEYTPVPASSWPPYRTIFRYQSSAQRAADTEYWLTWLADVDAVMGPIVNDQYDRCYFTGDGVPKVTSSSLVDAGVGAYPQDSKYIGVPAPLTAPTLAVSGVPTSTDPTDAISRSCVYTFVNTFGEESAPSPVSIVVETLPGEQIDITGLEISYSANYQSILEQRIYLTNTGTSGTEFQLVETISPPVVSAASVPHEFTAFGEILSTSGWSPPPEDMIGLTSLPWGALVGFAPNDPLGGSGNAVYMAQPYQPHAYLLENAFAVVEQIQALAAFGNSLLVLTDGLPTVTTGTDPAALSIERLEVGHSCTSKRGVVNIKGNVIYPAPEGLVAIGVGGSVLITESIFTEREWADYYPYTIVAAEYAGNYIGFFDSSYDKETGYTNPRDGDAIRGGFTYNPKTQQFVTLSGIEATALHSYLGGDAMALHTYPASRLELWEGDADSLMTVTWKSRPVFVSFEASFGAARVYASAYPVTASFYADDVEVHVEEVASEDAFRLPEKAVGRRWQVELVTTAEVYQVYLAPDQEQLDRVGGE